MDSSFSGSDGVFVWEAPSLVNLTYTPTLYDDGSFATAKVVTPARTITGELRGNALYAPPDTIWLTNIERSGPNKGTLTTTVFVGDPKALGWDYQTFGVWRYFNLEPGGRSMILASSAGAATPASAIPTTGSARFEGRLVGYFTDPSLGAIPPMAGTFSSTTADVTLTASFADRRVEFASTALNLVGASLYNDRYRLSGSLTYAPGQNRLSGPVTMTSSALTGTVTAQFYGPAAEEVGGALVLTTPGGGFERLTAGFGAKRQ